MSSDQPYVSIVIPFYNHGDFIRETAVSAISQTYASVEVIIVDDGSTDAASIRQLDDINHPRIRKIRTENQGLAMARNTGVCLAKGQYILPLDSDDLISNHYVELAVAQLEATPNLGIVYSEAYFIGSVNQRWELPPYDPVDFLVSNCIFCSGLFRKTDWELVGGYKSDMIYGLEDYDFWMSIVASGREVLKLPDVHFFYRKHGGSMISKMTPDKMHYSYQKIIQRHQAYYDSHIMDLIIRISEQKRTIDALKSGQIK